MTSRDRGTKAVGSPLHIVECNENFLYETGIDACACPATPTEGQVNNNPVPCVYCIQGGAITMMYCDGASGCTGRELCPNNHAIMNDACINAYSAFSTTAAPAPAPTAIPTYRVEVPGTSCWTFVLDNDVAVGVATGDSGPPICTDPGGSFPDPPNPAIPTPDQSTWCKRRRDGTTTFWQVARVDIAAASDFYGIDTSIHIQRHATAADVAILDGQDPSALATLSSTIAG